MLSSDRHEAAGTAAEEHEDGTLQKQAKAARASFPFKAP